MAEKMPWQLDQADAQVRELSTILCAFHNRLIGGGMPQQAAFALTNNLMMAAMEAGVQTSEYVQNNRAVAIIGQFWHRDIQLYAASDGTIRYPEKSEMTEGDIQLIRDNKPALLRVLTTLGATAR
jgi:hypothetical protein